METLFFYCGDGASVVQGEHGGVVAILGELQQQVTGYNVIVVCKTPNFRAATSRLCATAYKVFSLEGALFQNDAADCKVSPKRSRNVWSSCMAVLKARSHLRQLAS